jgi:hypothetical protein
MARRECAMAADPVPEMGVDAFILPGADCMANI